MGFILTDSNWSQTRAMLILWHFPKIEDNISNLKTAWQSQNMAAALSFAIEISHGHKKVFNSFVLEFIPLAGSALLASLPGFLVTWY